jgi:4-amino-4-deoxy-L-arabinose transferase-like glycosyltransferase
LKISGASSVRFSINNQQSTIKNQQFPMTTRTRTDVLLLAGFCAFLFFYGLGQFGLIGADEPRYAQVAREMLERHDWITPVLNGRPWLEKPPLYYWQAMLAYSLFGVTDWAARIPSAIDATLMVVAVYLFFRRFRRSLEVDAALITASCAGVIGFARAASMDMALAAVFTVGMLAWWAWRESGSRGYLAMFYVALALGVLAKGPVAALLAGAVIVFHAAMTREWHLVPGTLWLPGVLLFSAISLPWYFAVQMRNPEFFRVFILEHNLARFSSDLYHHREPFWYYIPITALALIPWTVFVLAAVFQTIRVWWEERRTAAASESDLELQFSVFTCCWLLVPVFFFSVSQSKLPGYILPAVPAGAVLLADYLRRQLQSESSEPVSKWLVIVHALIATAPLVPALLISRLLEDHRLPGGKAILIALVAGLVLAAGIALTLLSELGLRMLRFVTLVPVILSMAAVLEIGSTGLDRTLSARLLAAGISSVETHRLPLAVFRVSRELEYGLTFYRNQPAMRYEWGQIPAEQHLLVAPENWQPEVTREVAQTGAGRRVSFLGHYGPQHVDYFWVSAAGAMTH